MQCSSAKISLCFYVRVRVNWFIMKHKITIIRQILPSLPCTTPYSSADVCVEVGEQHQGQEEVPYLALHHIPLQMYV